MRKLFFILSLILSFNALADTKTYQCGENCTATLDTETGVMKVSGTSEMTGYDDAYGRFHTPWYNERRNIKAVIVEEGITKVGYNAFYDCRNIETIELAKSVQTVDAAFDEVFNVKSVTMYDSTVWNDQDNLNDKESSPNNIKINCYGDLDKCKTNFLNTPKMKSAANFNYKGKKIYTIDEANKVTGERNRVSIKYR